MTVSDYEKKIGINCFFTTTPGVNGKLRAFQEDFIVEEQSIYPPEELDGRFVIARVTSKNWETNLLIREISNRLHVSRKKIEFAGTKDKRAITTQLMSLCAPVEDVTNIMIRDVNIENLYTSNKPVKIGSLVGNSFKIVVRNIELEKSVAFECIQQIISFILCNDGFPNFYGVQRFGIIRPITHVVGKYVVEDDFEKAVMTYVANPIQGENEKAYEVRKLLQETHDFPEALKSYPNHLNFEKAILNKLVVDPKDFVVALKILPKNLLMMFIHAYQSYIFNKILSERIKRKFPLNKAIVGDIILPVRKKILSFDKNGILVTEKNIEKINKQIAKDKAYVSGLLPGFDSGFSHGEMGEIEHRIVEQEKIVLRDFVISEVPFLSSSGSRRSLLTPLKKIDWKLQKDKLNNEKLALTLEFKLPKGCYATSLLRELMKSRNVVDY